MGIFFLLGVIFIAGKRRLASIIARRRVGENVCLFETPAPLLNFDK